MAQSRAEAGDVMSGAVLRRKPAEVDVCIEQLTAVCRQLRDQLEEPCS